MNNAYAYDQDRETRRHFDRMHAKGAFHGVVLEIPDSDISTRVQQELQRILGKKADVKHHRDLVFFAGNLESQLLAHLKRYILSQEGIRNKKIVEGIYDDFVGHPNHWLEHAGYRI